MATVIELADARDEAGAGAKARVLAELLSAGFAVPPAVVVCPGQIEPSRIRGRVAHLGARFAVRSSSMLEDRDHGAAPGVYTTLGDVALADVGAAIEEVRASAAGETARVYAEVMAGAAPAALAVIVQRWIAGTSGTIYSRAPGDASSMMTVLAGATPVHATFARAGEPPAAAAAGLLSRARLAELRDLALAIEATSTTGQQRGVDIEWVIGEDDLLWVVQARPLPEARQGLPKPSTDAFAFALDEPELVWRWDVDHNPEPLSMAQRGLVELVSAAVVREQLGHRLKIVCGYLYEALAPAPDAGVDPIAPSARELEALFFESVEADLDPLLTRAELEAPGLEAAIEAFLEVNRRYAELGPILGSARAATANEPGLSPTIGAGLLAAISRSDAFSASTRASARARAARGEADYWRPYAGRWDVAAACYDERPDALKAIASRLERTDRAHDQPMAATPAPSPLAAVASAVAELDDRLFYRAQRLVRRGILGLAGDVLGESRFDLSLDSLLAWERGEGRPPDAPDAPVPRRQMPLEVRGSSWLYDPPCRWGRALRGVGSGGRAKGRAVISLEREPANEDGDGVIVARDLTPGQVLAAARSTAIVLEGSHLLGHAAAMARELGIPIVTAVAGATSQLREGEDLWIDGDAGLVIRLEAR